MRAIKPWKYNLPPPEGAAALGAENVDHDLRRKLRKLVTACQQDDDGVYRLEGTTFRMTITPAGEEKLWGSI